MCLNVVDLLLQRHIIVALVASSLPLEASNALLDVSLDHAQLIDGLLLRALDLSSDLVMQFLILVDHLVLQLPDLHLDHLIGLLYLEVGNLGAQRFDLFSDFLDKFAALLRV